MQVWFQKCGCGIFREPHGHFYDSAKGRCPTATMATESGKIALQGIARERGLSAAETAKIRKQIKDVGMRAHCGSEEYVAALFVADWFK